MDANRPDATGANRPDATDATATTRHRSWDSIKSYPPVRPHMRVKEVMSADVVTVDLDETVATAAERMLRRDVGSVVVMHEGAPAGILTESDAMRAGVVTGAPFSEIPIRQAASSSLETIVPTTTVRTAAKRMVSAEVKKLVVVDDLELRGIVTMSDLVRNQHDIVREARQLDAKRTEWES